MNSLVESINKLKKEKNAVILAHCYQNVEIDKVADFVGDSLYLSKKAKDTDADIIVFAGVSFMAETAKLLSPEKKVLLPRLEAGCFMANMINIESLREFKSLHPNVPSVCYVNSTAEIKAECDVCCTSSNALKVVKNIAEKENTNEVLFLPDTYLGKWVEKQLEGKIKVTTYNGFCPTHLRLRKEDIENSRKEYPNSKILAHPECHWAVSELADFVGSTKEIMEYVKNTDFSEYTIATEKGVFDRLQRDYSNKTFHLLSDSLVCKNMKWNTLDDIYNSLLREEHEIFLDDTISEKAMACINKMFQITKPLAAGV
ncbi:quinolinate synthase NadA [bacterium]|nr:quinolinate synthase NadA [bacterium]